MNVGNFKGLSVTTGIALLLILTISVGSQAEEPGAITAMGEMGEGEAATMHEDMMAMHQKMHAGMAAMDERLDALVVEMHAAGKTEKADAVAAVVAELVSQRKTMHGMMMKMQPQAMQHMAEHMASGMMSSMGDCPMMKGMTSDEPSEHEEHSEHHPGG